MVECEKLKMSFGDRLIFEDVSFTIPDGGIVGVYGPSGIGKSTLSKLLCGIYPPQAGRILLDGELLCSDTRPYDRKRGLGIQMVYQQPYASLDHSQKIGSAFRELIRYHHFAPDRAGADALTAEILAEVGLDETILGHRPHQISGGEAQRVAVARSLLFHPRLLILDEATSMLDVSTQANVLSLVKRVMEKNSGSVLFISHDSELVEHFCDKVHVLDNYHLS